ncbi:MAG: hypothetical protein DRR06_13485 [Gammaproteobacteria bacterium]|nr:MAG: hypothetical protein DRR06_13485 [Gammaproteobacteria bacterium]
MNVETKFKIGRRMVPVTLEYNDDHDKIKLHFRFNRPLLDIVKTSFEGRRWLGPIPGQRTTGPKLWEIPVTQRNDFVLQHLQARHGGESPYSKYDHATDESYLKPTMKRVEEYFFSRYGDTEELYKHQVEMVAHALLTNDCLLACEMGTGKTLAALLYMEMSGLTDWVWVAPNSALRAFYEEVDRWKPLVSPVPMTYDGLKKYVARGRHIPQGVVFDESVRIKTPTSQRSVAARNLANELRRSEFDTALLLLSGSPAPHSPLDWWHQCEVTQPGFLREGNVFLFRERLGIFEDANEGAYKKHVTWRDTEEKCATCGELRTSEAHGLTPFGLPAPGNHSFIEGKDEVSFLYKRMKGLVLVKLKKDCLDLPDKVYEQRKLKPSRDTLMAAKLIVDTSSRAIECLTGLRMLSDGFSYTQEETGTKVCALCNGKQEYPEFFDPDDPSEFVPDEWANQGIKYLFNDDGDTIGEKEIVYSQRIVECLNCGGAGSVPSYTRTATLVECPKDEELRNDLDVHTEIGRLNIYAGFTASVDRVVSVCNQQGWDVLRVDGRGWQHCPVLGEEIPNEKLLNVYQHGFDECPRLAFVAQPGAGGEGLTLTASPTTIYYSNDFNASSRIQSEDRIHRIGMDIERGAKIVDYLHLPSDLYVLTNLKQKKSLQRQTMTGLKEVYANV